MFTACHLNTPSLASCYKQLLVFSCHFATVGPLIFGGTTAVSVIVLPNVQISGETLHFAPPRRFPASVRKASVAPTNSRAALPVKFPHLCTQVASSRWGEVGGGGVGASAEPLLR